MTDDSFPTLINHSSSYRSRRQPRRRARDRIRSLAGRKSVSLCNPSTKVRAEVRAGGNGLGHGFDVGDEKAGSARAQWFLRVPRSERRRSVSRTPPPPAQISELVSAASDGTRRQPAAVRRRRFLGRSRSGQCSGSPCRDRDGSPRRSSADGRRKDRHGPAITKGTSAGPGRLNREMHALGRAVLRPRKRAKRCLARVAWAGPRPECRSRLGATGSGSSGMWRAGTERRNAARYRAATDAIASWGYQSVGR